MREAETSDSEELDLTVAPDARGWLGAYLLDRLVGLAAGDGIRNLRADVLVHNGAMIALLHHRRYANAGHDDHTVAHVVVAVSAETPQWPRHHDRPRILIEGGGLGWIPNGLSRSLGVDVLQCPGPRQGPCAACPALEGRTCPLAAGADAVVCAINPDLGRSELLDAHRRRHRRTRVFVTHPAGGRRVPVLGDAPALALTELTLTAEHHLGAPLTLGFVIDTSHRIQLTDYRSGLSVRSPIRPERGHDAHHAG